MFFCFASHWCYGNTTKKVALIKVEPIKFINVRHSVFVPLYCLDFLGPHSQAHNMIFDLSRVQITSKIKKIFQLLRGPPLFLFFLHAKLEVLRSFFPPFGEAMPSTKPDKNRMGLLKAHATTNAFIAPCTKHFTKVSHQFFLHTPQYTAGVLWGEASRWLQVQKIQGDRTKRRISTRKNWEATAGREGAWEVDSKKETV